VGQVLCFHKENGVPALKSYDENPHAYLLSIMGVIIAPLSSFQDHHFYKWGWVLRKLQVGLSPILQRDSDGYGISASGDSYPTPEGILLGSRLRRY
jgi:hypothetical protein